MNLGTLIGEQSLRIEQLEDLLRGQGVDPSAGADVRELQAKLRAAIEAKESISDAYTHDKKRLELINEGLRRQLQGHTLQVKLDDEIKGRTADAIAFRKRIMELEWQVKKAGVASSITAGLVPSAPAAQQTTTQQRMQVIHESRRGRTGPRPFRPGTLGAMVVELLKNEAPRELSLAEMAGLLGLPSPRINWVLRDLVFREWAQRTGTARNYRYKLIKEIQRENNA